MTRVDLNAVTRWITAAAITCPATLADEFAHRTGVTRRSASHSLRKLVHANWLVREGTSRRPVYRPGLLRQVVHHYRIAGLQEDLPWTQDFAPYFALPAAVLRLVQHAFHELLNNAIDHSEGQRVTVSLRQTPSHVHLLVSDDGRGLFNKLRDTFSYVDTPLAMLHLSKGRLTSAPQGHRGHGLFFTARLADVCDVHANGEAFRRQRGQHAQWQAVRALVEQGTSVFVGIALDTERTLDGVLTANSLNGQSHALETTRLPLHLLQSERVALDSRAQARRLVHGLQAFQRIEVDFDQVSSIGHGFADELFRVQARQLPGVQLTPINMSRAVAALLASVDSSVI